MTSPNNLLVVFVILVVAASIFLTWTSLNQTNGTEKSAINDFRGLPGKITTTGFVGIDVIPQPEGAVS